MISVVNDPNSQMAFWFSMIPFTSPVVMMARIPYGISLWEIILSLVILYASFTAMVWFAAKIYRVGIFMYGKKRRSRSCTSGCGISISPHRETRNNRAVRCRAARFVFVLPGRPPRAKSAGAGIFPVLLSLGV